MPSQYSHRRAYNRPRNQAPGDAPDSAPQPSSFMLSAQQTRSKGATYMTRVSRLSLALSAFVAICLLASAAAQAADTYNLDNAHCSIIFRIEHMGTSFVYGRFNTVAGNFIWDDKDPSAISFNVTVQTDSVDTHQPQRDNHLRSPTFFSAKEFPTITFKSKSVKKTGDKTYDVTGDMTLHGVTKEITVPMTMVGAADTQMGQRAGWDTSFKINKADYGIKGMAGIGDEVTLMIGLEGKK
jgi:polyisoprenoid-binding protein YceI